VNGSLEEKGSTKNRERGGKREREKGEELPYRNRTRGTVEFASGLTFGHLPSGCSKELRGKAGKSTARGMNPGERRVLL